MSLFKSTHSIKNEVLAGVTVSFAMIPEVVAFGFIAGISPTIALHTTVIIAILAAIFGGRPGIVSGAAGAIAIVLVDLIKNYGLDYLFAAVVVAGAIQIVVGLLKWGKFIRLVPQSVMYGFVNGLAVVIFLAQIKQLKFPHTENWLSGYSLYVMVGLIGLTILTMVLATKFIKQIPAALLALIVCYLVSLGFGTDVIRIGDIAKVENTLPGFHLPNIPFTYEAWSVVFSYGAIIAGVALVESLLTLNVMDEMTQTKGVANREAVGQGIANTVVGFFGGMGGCAMIGQSILNVNSGGRGRLSGVVMGVTILLFMLVGNQFIESVPTAALIGIMIVVAFKTFEWGFFKMYKKMPTSDVLIAAGVALITIFLHNLALAVLCGIIASALVFAWESARRIRIKRSNDSEVTVYKVYGPLFFGSITTFVDRFVVEKDQSNVYIDFTESRVADMSAIEAIQKISDKYKTDGKHVKIGGLSADSALLLRNADALLSVEIDERLNYHVMPK